MLQEGTVTRSISQGFPGLVFRICRGTGRTGSFRLREIRCYRCHGSEVTGRFIEDWRALKPDTPCVVVLRGNQDFVFKLVTVTGDRSEEHTSELQSLMRNSYAVFCLKKKNTN